jgi:hypothetical protein
MTAVVRLRQFTVEALSLVDRARAARSAPAMTSVAQAADRLLADLARIPAEDVPNDDAFNLIVRLRTTTAHISETAWSVATRWSGARA